MYLLTLGLGILYICGKVGHRTDFLNAHALALLLDGRLHACPYDVVDGELVTEDDLLVVIDVDYCRKTLIIRCEEVQECRVLTEMI